MITIPVKLLGRKPQRQEMSGCTLNFNHGATVSDLIAEIKTLDIDPDSDQIIIILDGRGIHQYPPEQLLQAGNEVIIFPNISGGSANRRTP